jgi:fibronectin type 3 domain-containing protein
MPLDSTYGADTFYLDRTVVPDTTYAYTVTAVDRMGNESASSAAILIATEPCVGESGPLTELTLEWDPSEERDVSGYLVYWGLRPGEYQWVLDTMADTVATVTELMSGNTYFFAVTAYDRDGTQSELSPEIAYIIP